MDYFTLFDLPLDYNLDMSQLTLRYQELQRQWHPDGFVNASEREKLLALQHAAIINQAYQTLKHPLERAEYLLSFHGYNVRDEQQTMQDTPFLLQQLEWREELANIPHLPDAEAVLLVFSERIDKISQQYKQQLDDDLVKQQWLLATDALRKLRFLDKIQQQISQLEEQLLDS